MKLAYGSDGMETTIAKGFKPQRVIDNPPEESKLEEVYFFKFSKPSGFGFQRIYTDDRNIDEAFSIEENDTVIIPKGYHPVAAAPGYSLYYLWILAGEGRKLIPNDDPDHKWILE